MEIFLKKHYTERVVPELRQKLGRDNIHVIPRIDKIVLNSGIDASADKAHIELVVKDITNLAGQKAVVTRARKSVANFKLREGMPVGVKVTLRGARMYDFLLRLIAIALPNIRDFRGVARRFDGRGNYTIGIADHTIFPEISADTQGRAAIGLDVTIVTTARSDDEGRELLTLMGMPFRKVTNPTATTTEGQAAPAEASANA